MGKNDRLDNPAQGSIWVFRVQICPLWSRWTRFGEPVCGRCKNSIAINTV